MHHNPMFRREKSRAVLITTELTGLGRARQAPDIYSCGTGLPQTLCHCPGGGTGGHYIIDHDQITPLQCMPTVKSTPQVALALAGVQGLLFALVVGVLQQALHRQAQLPGELLGDVLALVEAALEAPAPVQGHGNNRFGQGLPRICSGYFFAQQFGEHTAVAVLFAVFKGADQFFGRREIAAQGDAA